MDRLEIMGDKNCNQLVSETKVQHPYRARETDMLVNNTLSKEECNHLSHDVVTLEVDQPHLLKMTSSMQLIHHNLHQKWPHCDKWLHFSFENVISHNDWPKTILQYNTLCYTYWFHMHINLHIHVDLIQGISLGDFSLHCHMVSNFPVHQRRVL